MDADRLKEESNSRPPRPPAAPTRFGSDVRLATMLGVVAAIVGMAYLCTSGVKPAFYQSYFGPAIMFASGKGFLWPVKPELCPPLAEFLALKVDSFDPATLPEEFPLADPTGFQPGFQPGHRYLEFSVAITWWLFGISWSGLLPLYGLLCAATVVSVYGLMRLAMPRSLAVVGALLFLTSPMHLRYLPDLRDYSKAPFILSALCVMGYLIKRPCGKRAFWALAAACGVLLGFGVGFRADALVCVPAFLAVVLLFVPGKLSWRIIGIRLAAMLVFLVGFMLPARPVMSASGGGSNTYHVIILGLMTPFDVALGVGGPLYNIGSTYQDLLSNTIVNSYAHRILNVPNTLQFCTPEWDAASKIFYLHYARTFPADLAIRGCAAVLRVLDAVSFDTNVGAPRGVVNPFLLACYDVRRSLCGLFEGGGAWYAAVALVLLAAANLRVATACLFLLLYFGGYSCLQFDPRHHFHLQFVGWWSVGLLVTLCAQFIRKWAGPAKMPGLVRAVRAEPVRYLVRPGLRAGAFAACACLVMLGPLYALRGYQDGRVRGYLSRYAEAGLDPLELAMADGGNATKVLRYSKETGKAPAPDPADPFPIQTQVLVLELDGSQDDSIDVTVQYQADKEENDITYTTHIPLHVGPADDGPPVTRAFFPIYETTSDYWQSWRSFTGFVVPEEKSGCVKALYRVKNLDPFPLLLEAAFPPGWQRAPCYQTLRAEPPVYIRSRRSYRHNLLENGGFESWTPDGQAPLGFSRPGSRSSIGMETRFMAEGRAAVRQTWLESDAAEGLERFFGAWMKGLEPNATYELFVKARNLSSANVNIVAWQLTPLATTGSAGEPAPPGTMVAEPLNVEVVKVFPGAGFREYSGRFTTLPRRDSIVLLLTYAPAPTPKEAFPVTVIWDDWRLVEIPAPAMDADAVRNDEAPRGEALKRKP